MFAEDFGGETMTHNPKRCTECNRMINNRTRPNKSGMCTNCGSRVRNNEYYKKKKMESKKTSEAKP